MKTQSIKIASLLMLIAFAAMSPERASGQAACNSTGETINNGEYGQSAYAIGDLTVMAGSVSPTDVNDADWYFGAGADVDVYAAVTIPAGAVVRLKAGAILNVYGNFTNNGYLFVAPGATINFYGNTWTNATGATVGDGAATVNAIPGGAINFIAARPTIPASVSASACIMSNYSGGNFTQHIDGGNVPMDIALHVKNANNIQLINTNTKIEGTVVFDMVNGDVDLGNNNFVFTANGNWSSNVAPNAAYFLTNGTVACAGAVEKLGLAPAATFTFPIGRAETYSGGRDYTPAMLRNDGAAANNFQVRVKTYADAVSTSGVIIRVPQEGMDRAWQITSTNGTGVTMSLQHNSATNGTTYQNVFGSDPTAFITQYQGAGIWNVGPTPTNFTGTISGSQVHARGFSLTTTATSCSSANSWFTKTNDAITPLPVKLVSFAGAAKECDALLSWQTTSEESFSHFELEYGADAATFASIGSVTGKNNATGSSYAFLNAQPSGKGYYRLKMVDNNGVYSYSNMVTVTTSCDVIRTITLSPNPTSNVVHINGLNAGEQVQLYGVNGQLILNKVAVASAEVIDLSIYANGLYQVIILNKNERLKAIKVVKQ